MYGKNIKAYIMLLIFFPKIFRSSASSDVEAIPFQQSPAHYMLPEKLPQLLQQQRLPKSKNSSNSSPTLCNLGNDNEYMWSYFCAI